MTETLTLEQPADEQVATAEVPVCRVTISGDSTGTRNRSPTTAAESDEATDVWSKGLEWPAVIWLGTAHLGALAAPFVFTWSGLAVAIVLSAVTASLGVCIGFHRLLTHGGFETFPVVKRVLATLGMLAGEGPPIMWVAAHRKHHQFSDQDGDPHSPRDGAWWSHVVWMLPRRGSQYWAEQYRRYAPDMLRDPYMKFLDRTWMWWHMAMGGTLMTTGYVLSGLSLGLSLLVYGLFVRATYVFHVTWLVNSATHMWGYRNYETTDDSRNLWWVALLAYGEGWHNNHHAHQRLARHGHRWWEIDINFACIRLMERCGLAWNVIADVPGESEQQQVPADSRRAA